MKPIRVLFVAPIVQRYDAISAAVRDSYLALASDARFESAILTWRNDFPDVRSDTVSGVADLLLHPLFLGADVLFYHFGIYASLFDALLVGNGHAKQIADYHNVTPLDFVAQENRPLIEKSMRQVRNLSRADEIWCVSETNVDDLVHRGFDPTHLRLVPLAVETPPLTDLAGKESQRIEVLFVGRFVPSKGVLDLIRALKRRGSSRAIRLRLAGNESFSDPDYIADVRAEFANLNCEAEMLGTVDDAELQSLYQTSHVFAIPSYHEGFCKPVIEALRGGCIPVGYACYNLPNAIGGLGRVVPPGDVSALAMALDEVVDAIAQGLDGNHTYYLPLDAGPMTIAEFDQRCKDFVGKFTFARFAETIRGRVLALN